MEYPKLLAISGSLRKGSYNRMLLKEAVNAFGPATVITADLNVPLYDGDIENSEGIPASVQLLADQISEADGIIVSAPEYNKGISGVLKNALDWVSRVPGNVLKGKPTVVMSAAAGRSGGETALFMTLSCLSQYQVRLLLGPSVMIAGASSEFDENGNLKGESYRKALKTRMRALRDEICG